SPSKAEANKSVNVNVRSKLTKRTPLNRRTVSLERLTPKSGLTVFCRLAPAKATIVYNTYWHFAGERQAIFFRRAHGEPLPWTVDPILHDYKFTNVYRASDRVSQYLIEHVIYDGDQSPEETFYRILLFKIFNRIETWELLRRELGTVAYAGHTFERIDKVLTR